MEKSIQIINPFKVLTIDDIRPLRIFAQKKLAAQWCKENGVNPVRILKIRTRFQETYALDMGLNCFLCE